MPPDLREKPHYPGDLKVGQHSPPSPIKYRNARLQLS